jgi:CRP-like cAMP-binding protein
MPSDPKQIEKLREAWEKAVSRDRLKDALAALDGLELLDPKEAKWPQRKGDTLRRLGKTKEAEESFVRAVRCYQAQGFLARAAALAKAVVDLNPERADLLRELDPAPAKKIRDEVAPPKASPLNPSVPGPPRLPSALPAAPPAPARAAAPAPAARMPAPAPKPIPREEPLEFPKANKGIDVVFPPTREEEDREPSSIAGVRADRISVVAAAMGLEKAKDAAPDEVRFENVPEVYAFDVDLSELEDEPPPDSAPDLEVHGYDEETPTAIRLALMSAATLFVDVPKEAMSEMVAAAHLVDLPNGAALYRRGEPADGLYVVVEGKIDLIVPGTKKKLVVAEGSVFGEDSLLEGALRIATTRVNGRVLALKIPKIALDAIVLRHVMLGDVLFDVLVRRLITMALQTSTLFAAFDVKTRKELARLFEVRRAAAGTVVKQRGKRSDGLYLALAGELDVDDGSKITLGTMFGHSSLLSDAPEPRTVTVRKESVLLRLPAARFLSFAARVPAALTHLAELAQHPDAL